MSRFSNVVVLIALASACGLMSRLAGGGPDRDPAPAGSPSVDGHAAAVLIGGAEAMAAGVAVRDLVSAEAAATEDAGRLAPDGGVSPADPGAGWTQRMVDAAWCYMTPSNYEAQVTRDAGSRRWHVMVVPAGACMQNVFGGGGVYEIDADSFEILHRVPSE